MKHFMTTALFAGAALAVPRPQRGTGGGAFSITANDLQNDATCKDIYFIVARGSTEPGNIGVSVGPALCAGLKAKYGAKVGCQGIGGGYTASIQANTLPKGTSDASIKAAVDTFEQAHTKCPSSILVAEGYSQGAALMHNAVAALPEATKAQLAGVVLFGDTKNAQSKGLITGYPKEKTVTYCAKDDGVCWGRLQVTSGHLAYLRNGDEERAVSWLISKIESARDGVAVAPAPAVVPAPVGGVVVPVAVPAVAAA